MPSDKVRIITEGAKWLADWLGEQDADLKNCSMVVITVTDGRPGQTCMFDMMTNEEGGMVLHMLTFAIQEVLTGKNSGSIDLPKATKPS